MLEGCVICQSPAKYRCPACTRCTCSAFCCNKHKSEFECSGKQSFTPYKPLGKFTDADILGDYRHLEQISREVGCIRQKSRDLGRGFSRLRNGGMTAMHRLRRACSRQDCRLQFAPCCFVRHRLNTSYFDASAGLIKWRVDCELPVHQIQLSSHQVRDDRKLCNVIGNILREAVSSGNSASSDVDPLLLYLAALETRTLCLFIRQSNRGSYSYKRLSLSSSVRAALKGLTILEYPCFYAVTEHNCCMFDSTTRTNPDKTNRSVISHRPVLHRSAYLVSNNKHQLSDLCDTISPAHTVSHSPARDDTLVSADDDKPSHHFHLPAALFSEFTEEKLERSVSKIDDGGEDDDVVRTESDDNTDKLSQFGLFGLEDSLSDCETH